MKTQMQLANRAWRKATTNWGMVTKYDLTEDMEGDVDITPVPESHEGRFVALEDYNALAAENAGFKHALSVILEHVEVTDKGRAGVVAMIANDALFNSETTATDAALAAIQVQGVEKFAGLMLTLASDPTYSTASHRNDLRDAGAQAINYAAELREAK